MKKIDLRRTANIVGRRVSTVWVLLLVGWSALSSAQAIVNESAKLIPSDGDQNDEFGSSVAVSADLIVVGAKGHNECFGCKWGSAYVFARSGNDWVQQAKLIPSATSFAAEFGKAVAVSGDTVLVGAWLDDNGPLGGAGSASVFVRNGSVWTEQQKLFASDAFLNDFFGTSVAVSSDTAVVGAQQALENEGDIGSAYVFVRNGSTWTEEAKLFPEPGTHNGLFGVSVSLSGDTLVVGASKHWHLGITSGAAYVYRRTGSNWALEQMLTASDRASTDAFGDSVGIDGDTIVVGVPKEDANGSNAGAAYIFSRAGTIWTEDFKLLASDGAAGDVFGHSVAISGNTIVVGAYSDDESDTDSGSAYQFQKSGDEWIERAKLVPSDGAWKDRFGESVAVSGNTVAVGARTKDEYDFDSGSAYVFDGVGIEFQVMGIVSTGDVSGDGNPEIGVAMPGSTRVHIRDGSTDALISDVNFGSDAALQMTVLPDLDASGDAEIAVLNEQASGQVRVQIRDSVTGNLVTNLWYGAQYEPVAMALVPDYSGNSDPEIAVLGSESGTDVVRIQVRDSSSNTFLDNVFLGTQSVAHDVVSLTDTSGNGVPELGILGVLKANDQVRMQVWDAQTAAFQNNIWFGKVYQPQSTITMPDINLNGSDEVVAVGVDLATQNIRVQVRDSETTDTLFTIWLGLVNKAVGIALINDINSDGTPDLAILLETPGGTGRVRVQSGANGAFIRNLFYTAVESPVGLAVMPDYSGNGFDELAVLGENAGTRHVQILDTSTGAQVNRIDFP